MAVYGNLLNINITVEQLEEFRKSNNLVVNESFDFKNCDLLNKLKKYIEDTNKSYLYIIDDIINCGKNVASIFNTKGINKTTISESTNIIENMFSKISKDFKINDIDMINFKGYDANKIKNANKVFFWVLIIQLLLMIIFATIFGFEISNIIVALIIGPITEEIAKKISIKGDFEKEFFVIFNAFEMTSYTVNISKQLGVKPIKVLSVRIFPVLIHTCTTIIQYITNNKKFQQKLKIEENNKSKVSMIGTIIGTLIHIIWNTIATIFSSKINSLLLN